MIISITSNHTLILSDLLSIMRYSQQKQRVSITVDSSLLEEVDKLTDNRSAAFEEGIGLWYAQQI